jgi:hypothetical protein
LTAAASATLAHAPAPASGAQVDPSSSTTSARALVTPSTQSATRRGKLIAPYVVMLLINLTRVYDSSCMVYKLPFHFCKETNATHDRLHNIMKTQVLPECAAYWDNMPRLE